MVRVYRSQKTAADLVIKIVLAVSFLSLFLFLDIKPAQHDEGVNGWILEKMTATGLYKYDSAHYHGPLHFYILFSVKSLLGRSLWALRLSAVMFAMGGIFLMTRMAPYVGRFTAYTAALFSAVSPGIIFYSRYAIHESTLFFFSLLTLLGFLRFKTKSDRMSLWQLGIGFAGMITTKETYILSVACFAVAYGVVRLYEKISPSDEVPPKPARSYEYRDVVYVVLTVIFIIVLFYSSFFMNWEGLWGILKTYWDWFVIGAGSSSEQKGHWKYFFYWLELFSIYEWTALCGIFLCYYLLGPARRWTRVIGIYGLGLLLIYSMISYKTPWCILQLIWPFLFVIGAALETLSLTGNRLRKMSYLLVALLAVLGLQRSIELNFFRFADDKEPYVHVQTYEDILSIQGMLDQLVSDDPALQHMQILVIKKAYWPLSWMLAQYTKADFYPEDLPPMRDAKLIFVDQDRQYAMETKMRNSYFVQSLRFNPAQKDTIVYLDKDMFREFFDEDAPSLDPQIPEQALPGQGLTATHYRNTDWSGKIIRFETTGTVDFVITEENRGKLTDPFSVVFEGEIHIPESGRIRFYLASDDGSELTVNGEKLIDNLGNHRERMVSASKNFKLGWYPIRLKYFDVGGNASCRLWWRLPSGKQERISPQYFRHQTNGKKKWFL